METSIIQQAVRDIVSGVSVCMRERESDQGETTMLIYTNDSSLCRKFAFFIAPSIVIKSFRSIDLHKVGFCGFTSTVI